MGSFLVRSGFLLLLFGDGGQQPASLVAVLFQERPCPILRQLDVLQLLQQVAALLWKTAAHWRPEGQFEVVDAGLADCQNLETYSRSKKKTLTASFFSDLSRMITKQSG